MNPSANGARWTHKPPPTSATSAVPTIIGTANRRERLSGVSVMGDPHVGDDPASSTSL